MDTGFQWFPDRASRGASEIDDLYFFLILVSTFFTAVIFLAVVVFAVKYRRRSEDEKAVQVRPSMVLEIVWIVIPLGLCGVMFFWGASTFFSGRRPPSDALDVYVVARQWMWKLQHGEGAHEINELHVPLGRAVRLTMTSIDVIHSFFVPAFRIKQDVVPGRYTNVWFEPTRVGEYHLFCAEYCGTNHSGMIGRVVVLTPRDYERWLQGGTSQGSLAAGGHALFLSMGCSGCHTEASDARCPSLRGLYGGAVRLQGGGTVVADEAYLRESILDPPAKIVSGFQPIMPSFRGRLSEEDLLMLVAYIKSLGYPQEAARD